MRVGSYIPYPLDILPYHTPLCMPSWALLVWPLSPRYATSSHSPLYALMSPTRTVHVRYIYRLITLPFVSSQEPQPCGPCPWNIPPPYFHIHRPSKSRTAQIYGRRSESATLSVICISSVHSPLPTNHTTYIFFLPRDKTNVSNWRRRLRRTTVLQVVSEW